MEIVLSKHAEDQIKARSVGKINGRVITPLVTRAEVLDAVAEHESEILTGGQHANVIVKKFQGTVVAPDGKSPDKWSNGDHLVAVVDPGTKKICTVMLQRGQQIETRKTQGKLYI